MNRTGEGRRARKAADIRQQRSALRLPPRSLRMGMFREVPHRDAPVAKVVVCSAEMDGKSKLDFGDNVKILRGHVADASVDLIYLDPPFNSNATYNVLFKEKSRVESAARCRPSAMHLRGKQCGKSVSLTRGCTSSAWSKA